jgi:CheY-like chemotaxis protein
MLFLDDAIVAGAGASIISSIRADVVTANVPISIFTDATEGKFQEIADTTPHVRLVRKPFTAQTLVNHVREICFGEEGLEKTSALVAEAKVLVIEPDQDLLEWIEVALHRKKIAFHATTRIEEAVEAARQHAPDVVLIDIDGMPNAQERLANLRGMTEMTASSFYVLSGIASADSAPPAGIDGILTKPFTAAQLLELVHQGRGAAAHKIT